MKKIIYIGIAVLLIGSAAVTLMNNKKQKRGKVINKAT